MTNQQAAPFELGKITVKPHPTMSGHFQARGYYRDRSHRRQEATASGKSHTGATRALKLKVASAEHEHEHVGGTAALNGSARISEALFHTAWADVDLEAETVRVRGTKTKRADRVLSLSPRLANRLRLRADTYGTTGQVFGTTRYAVGRSGEDLTGKPRDRQNVLKVLRRVLTNAGMPWAGSHTFRRTVASWMDAQGAALAEIGAQLGHGDLNVTAGYLGRTVTPTRAASIMVLP